MKMHQTQIVILGGGYVSIWAYRSMMKHLEKEINDRVVRIIIVSPDEFHYFHGWTAESLTCIIRDRNRMSPLIEVMPLAKFIHGRAEEIDTSGRLVKIRLNNGVMEQIQYDHLLIGTGSIDNTEVNGINQHAFQIKSHQEFLRTKSFIQELVYKAGSPGERDPRKWLSFVIAGGGFTGVEITANIAEFVKVLMKEYPSLKNIRPNIRLVQRNDQILNTLEPGLQAMRRYAEKILAGYGVDIISNRSIEKVNENGVLLDDGQFIPCGMAITTIGQRRGIMKGTEEMKRDGAGRLVTSDYLMLLHQANIWGGGDACHVRHPGNGQACPANALWAINQGACIGRNIARAIHGKKLRPFNYRGLGQCASLGIGKGMGDLYGLVFTGWSAWIMRLLFFFYYMPSHKVMISAISDWLFFFFRGKRRDLVGHNRDTSHLGHVNIINRPSYFSQQIQKLIP